MLSPSQCLSFPGPGSAFAQGFSTARAFETFFQAMIELSDAPDFVSLLSFPSFTLPSGCALAIYFVFRSTVSTGMDFARGNSFKI